MPTPQRRSLVGRADDRSISQCPGLRAASFGCRAGQEEQTPSSAASAQTWCVGPAVPRSRYVDPPTPLREPEQAAAPPAAQAPWTGSAGASPGRWRPRRSASWPARLWRRALQASSR